MPLIAGIDISDLRLSWNRKIKDERTGLSHLLKTITTTKTKNKQNSIQANRNKV